MSNKGTHISLLLSVFSNFILNSKICRNIFNTIVTIKLYDYTLNISSDFVNTIIITVGKDFKYLTTLIKRQKTKSTSKPYKILSSFIKLSNTSFECATYCRTHSH